jgi:hypothetical protein
MDLSQHSERGYIIGSEAVAIAAAQPRAASTPPAEINRFAVRLTGLDEATLLDRWRALCQDGPGGVRAPDHAAFADLYGRVTLLRGSTFHFRAGDRERTREILRGVFAPVAPGVQAELI